jgi:4-hydroxybenzoyl-CoA thioesterase
VSGPAREHRGRAGDDFPIAAELPLAAAAIIYTHGYSWLSGASMSAFQREILVRFGHCDAAGWVFYPRYFEMISDFVEDWFEDGLAASAPGLFHHKQILTPSVHFTVDFPKPTRYGDRLTFNLWTTKVGRTSCELRIEASHQGELRMTARQVLVFISAELGRATEIPPELVSRMARFGTDPETAAKKIPVPR